MHKIDYTKLYIDHPRSIQRINIQHMIIQLIHKILGTMNDPKEELGRLHIRLKDEKSNKLGQMSPPCFVPKSAVLPEG